MKLEKTHIGCSKNRYTHSGRQVGNQVTPFFFVVIIVGFALEGELLVGRNHLL